MSFDYSLDFKNIDFRASPELYEARSRRYANHKSGKKDRTNPQKASSKAEERQARKDVLPNEVDPLKAESAALFKEKWQQAKANEKYVQLLANHKETKSRK